MIRSRLISWDWVWGWLVSWGGAIRGNSFVCNLGNVARVSISGSVGDDLGTTIGKGNTV